MFTKCQTHRGGEKRHTTLERRIFDLDTRASWKHTVESVDIKYNSECKPCACLYIQPPGLSRVFTLFQRPDVIRTEKYEIRQKLQTDISDFISHFRSDEISDRTCNNILTNFLRGDLFAQRRFAHRCRYAVSLNMVVHCSRDRKYFEQAALV